MQEVTYRVTLDMPNDEEAEDLAQWCGEVLAGIAGVHAVDIGPVTAILDPAQGPPATRRTTISTQE